MDWPATLTEASLTSSLETVAAYAELTEKLAEKYAAPEGLVDFALREEQLTEGENGKFTFGEAVEGHDQLTIQQWRELVARDKAVAAYFKKRTVRGRRKSAREAARAVLPTGKGRLASIAAADGRTFTGDDFVFACGPWLAKVFPELLGRRIFPTRQEVFYFGPPSGDARLRPPQMPVWIDDIAQWYGIPDIEGKGFKLAQHAMGPAFDPDSGERSVSPEGLAAARRAAGTTGRAHYTAKPADPSPDSGGTGSSWNGKGR